MSESFNDTEYKGHAITYHHVTKPKVGIRIIVDGKEYEELFDSILLPVRTHRARLAAEKIIDDMEKAKK